MKPQKIKMTPEMLEAGEIVLTGFRVDSEDSYSRIVTELYEAMMEAYAKRA